MMYFVPIHDENRIDILNAKSSKTVLIKNTYRSDSFEMHIWDCQGRLKQSDLIKVKGNILECDVPHSWFS